MSYPVDAFVRCTSEKSRHGALVYVRDFWTFSTYFETPQGRQPKSLVLTGEYAGAIHGRFPDHGLCTAESVQIEIRVDVMNVVADGSYPAPASVVVPQGGVPEFWGHISGSLAHRYGFRLTGEPTSAEEHEAKPVFQFKAYEIWLTRDGKALSDKPLITVG